MLIKGVEWKIQCLLNKIEQHRTLPPRIKPFSKGQLACAHTYKSGCNDSELSITSLMYHKQVVSKKNICITNRQFIFETSHRKPENIQ
jgi:hypothetical protein